MLEKNAAHVASAAAVAVSTICVLIFVLCLSPISNSDILHEKRTPAVPVVVVSSTQISPAISPLAIEHTILVENIAVGSKTSPTPSSPKNSPLQH